MRILNQIGHKTLKSRWETSEDNELNANGKCACQKLQVKCVSTKIYSFNSFPVSLKAAPAGGHLIVLKFKRGGHSGGRFDPMQPQKSTRVMIVFVNVLLKEFICGVWYLVKVSGCLTVN